jgi:hypothetical protein
MPDVSSRSSRSAHVPRVFASFASLFTLLITDGLAGAVSTASATAAGGSNVPTIDVEAPLFSGAAGQVRSGGQASRIELDDAELTARLSPWYRLAYVDGGTRLRVFDHYPTAISNPDADILGSETVAWQLANTVVGSSRGASAPDHLPYWARFRTGNDTGGSGGLMFTLAYIDALTPGALVGDLRVTGSGGIGPDGVVFPVSNLEVKVAAAMLTRPDVIFTTRPPKQTNHVTVVESQPTRSPTADLTVGEWLNVIGYQQAGRIAANQLGTVAVVVVHDLRQVLAWLCGRTESVIVCATARTSTSIPIGTATARTNERHNPPKSRS